MDPERARQRGLTSTVTFPRGNLAPEGSVIKSTAIDPSVVDADGVYRKTGPARVFTSERAAIAAIKGRGADGIKPGDVMVLICRGPLGAGMEEIYQITAALKHLSFGKHVAVLTDARFSGVSTGACIGHVGPEALAGGPIGRVLDGDLVRIVVDRNRLVGSVDLVGRDGRDVRRRGGRARARGAGAPRRIWRPIPTCPTTRGCGRRCSRRAGGRGAAASTTSTRSFLGLAADGDKGPSTSLARARQALNVRKVRLGLPRPRRLVAGPFSPPDLARAAELARLSRAMLRSIRPGAGR